MEKLKFEVTNLETYIEIINQLPKKRDAIKLFRGHESTTYKNIPTIGRPILKKQLNLNLLDLEHKLIISARLKMPNLLTTISYPIQELTRLRHYGLPTRLLDFTSNSLIALYFATIDKRIQNIKQDGKVLVHIEKIENIYTSYDPYINTIAEMYELENKNVFYFLEDIKSKKYWYFAENYPSVAEIKNNINKPRFFRQENDNERIIRQQGLFLIFPNEINIREKIIFIGKELPQWRPTEYYEIIIPENKKKGIRNQLREVGITESYIFPEYEHICNDIVQEEIDNWFKKSDKENSEPAYAE